MDSFYCKLYIYTIPLIFVYNTTPVWGESEQLGVNTSLSYIFTVQALHVFFRNEQNSSSLKYFFYKKYSL